MTGAPAIAWLFVESAREELDEKQMKGLDGREVLYPQLPEHDVQLM
jgi:hypothetical protein